MKAMLPHFVPGHLEGTVMFYFLKHNLPFCKDSPELSRVYLTKTGLTPLNAILIVIHEAIATARPFVRLTTSLVSLLNRYRTRRLVTRGNVNATNKVEIKQSLPFLYPTYLLCIAKPTSYIRFSQFLLYFVRFFK